MAKKILITLSCLFVLSVPAAFAAFYYSYHTEPGCEATGGRWASSPLFCYSKSCYQLGDCGGPWVSTAIPCRDVKDGETEAMLHFYFGNADRRTGNRIFWSTGKPGRETIEARVDDGKLVELICPR